MMICIENKVKENNYSFNIIDKKGENLKNIEKNNEEKYIKPTFQNKNKEKNDSTEQLLDIQYVNQLFMNNNKKFLENFEFLESIKCGGSGAVLKVRQKNIKNKERIVACKIISNSIKDKKEKFIEQKRHKEVSIHKRFHHKNIPEVYGYYPLGNDYSCLIMEYNKYGDIDNFKKKIIKRSCLSESLICYLANGILESLSFINKSNVIHMDIKQQNVLIDDFLNVKVTDFSVSVPFDKNEETIELPMVGTCYYMSPEVLKKKTIIINEASKIDIYSFGVLIYLLAFGDYPYELDEVDTKDYDGIYNNIIKKELVFPDETGHSLMFKNFVRKCLEKDIKKRYNIYEALNDPWIKGCQLILNEKENLYNAGKFMIEMMVDNIQPFNDYIKSE